MKNWLKLGIVYIIIASAVAFSWMAYEASPSTAGERALLTLAFLDVGQGDAIFIQSPTGTQVLIDGGINRDVLAELAGVMPFFDHSLDVVIATHPDKDHIGGLPHVLDRYQVTHIIDPGLEDTSDAYALYTDRLKAEGATYRAAQRGDVVDLGGGAYLRVLFPDGVFASKDKNDASVIVQLVYGETEALLTGDASDDIERRLIALDGYLESDILKAGHHGSKTSTAQEFLDVVDPEYAIVSARQRQFIRASARRGRGTFGCCEHNNTCHL
jgi:competence protein ComEC